MNKNLYTTLGIVTLVVVLLLLVFWYMGSGTPEVSPVDNSGLEGTVIDDSTDSINQSLDEVDLGNVDAEFQEVDSELENL